MASLRHRGAVTSWSARGFVFLAAALLAVLIPAGSELHSEPNEKQVALGRSVYQAQCARCHGKNLEGQPDWQARLPTGRLPAPPHDASGHTWHHPDGMLIGITKNGLKPYAGGDYESDMPAFGNILSEKEIEAVIDFIKSTWPEKQHEYQKRINDQAK